MKIKINIDEALRYLGAPQADAATREQAMQMALLLEEALEPRLVWKEYALEGLSLPEADLTLLGMLARRMLDTCSRASLLVCTLGAEFERLYRLWQARDMAKAVVLDACGSAYVEAGCDEAERQMAALHPGLFLTDRFSPGYGDLPLTLQDGILQATDAGRRLGVQATPSHLLIPSKTVTAVIGLSTQPQRARIRGCAYCALREKCTMRKGGASCESI